MKRVCYKIHQHNKANSSRGDMQPPAAATLAIRLKGSQEAARILGAHYHLSLTNDLEILYELKTLRRLAAVVRAVRPEIVLTHSPQDYMEDHTNTCRLAITAAFARGMRNFKTVPARDPVFEDVTVYHAMPHGLRDGLR